MAAKSGKEGGKWFASFSHCLLIANSTLNYFPFCFARNDGKVCFKRYQWKYLDDETSHVTSLCLLLFFFSGKVLDLKKKIIVCKKKKKMKNESDFEILMYFFHSDWCSCNQPNYSNADFSRQNEWRDAILLHTFFWMCTCTIINKAQLVLLIVARSGSFIIASVMFLNISLIILLAIFPLC